MNMKKIFVSILMIMLIISFCYDVVLAFDVTKKFGGSTPNETAGAARKILGGILAVVIAVGVTTAVVILMVIGIKYLIASAGDRADIKKYAVKYIIGALILFSASGLIGIAQKIIKGSVKAN